MSEIEFNDRIGGALQRAKAYLLSKYQISEPDLEDVLQEASLKAMQNLSSFLGKCSFETWFIAICKSEILNFYRKNKRREAFISKDDPEVHKELEWTEPLVFDSYDSEEREWLVTQALSSLSAKHREIIEIALRHSGSSQEIADLLQIPVNSARTRLHYAKKRLKQLIQIHAHKSNIQLTGS